MSKKVGVILVNYKEYAKRFLAECRDSLRLQQHAPEFKVYIIDNASSAESLAYLASEYPEAVVIPRNDGNYAAANNAGAKKAGEDGCDVFVIANMDVKFDANWLSELVSALDEDDQVSIVQSKILLYPRNESEAKNPKINSLGNKMHFLGFGFTDGYGEEDKGNTETETIRGYASGCSLAISRGLFEMIGGYDELYYLYHDDVELSWKAKLAGKKIRLAPKSFLFHKYEFDRSVRMLYYMERNRYLAVFTYYHPLTLLLISPALAIMEVGMFIFAWKAGWIDTKISVMRYFLTPEPWRHILERRKAADAIRRVKEVEIVQDFVGEIRFQEIMNPVLKYIANPVFNIYWSLVKKIIIW